MRAEQVYVVVQAAACLAIDESGRETPQSVDGGLTTMTLDRQLPRG